MDLVLVDDAEPVTTITLNRPDARNALSLEMMTALQTALRAAAQPVVVIAGSGPAFSAGHDLRELLAADHDEHERIFAACTELMTTVQSIDQPVIARVHGVATAAGCQLVAACDLAIAERGARFATPGVNIGLFCSTPMVPLSRSIGRKRALQMLLTGDMVDAATACDWGLVNAIVDPDELDATVHALAERIARSSRAVVARGKRAFYAQADMPQPGAYALAGDAMVGDAGAPDAKEGITAFLEKRSPAWPSRA